MVETTTGATGVRPRDRELAAGGLPTWMGSCPFERASGSRLAGVRVWSYAARFFESEMTA